VERLRRRQEQYIKWAVPESDVIVLGRIEATEKIRRFWYAVGEVYEMDAGNLLVSEVLAGSPRGEAIGVTMPARTGLPDLGREAVWFLARQADGSWYVNAAFELDDWLTRDRVAKLISLEN